MDPSDPFSSLDSARRRSAWRSVAVGLSLGILAAVLVSSGIRAYLMARGDEQQRMVQTVSAVELFRLPTGGDHEVYLLPAGPDGSGETALSAALFPGEDPPRELASLLLANVGRDGDWEVDLESARLAFRAAEGDDWAEFEAVPEAPETLDETLRLRLRSLGAGTRRLTIGPRSMKRVLLALPARRQFGDLSDVQWGGMPLRADRLDVGSLRRLHEDPALSTERR